MKYKVSIIGYLAKQKPLYDGQTVKTKQLASLLHEHLSDEEIGELDMQGMRQSPVSFFWNYYKLCRNSENVIILPAHGALLLFPLLCVLFRGKNTKLIYDVIGGWLPGYVEKYTYLKFFLKKFDQIWVETSVMKNALEKKDFKHIIIVPNFKALSIVDKSEMTKNDEFPLSLCIFSRIIAIKGIEDGINAVKTINQESGKTIFKLDLYGQIDNTFKDRFEELQSEFPDYIKYCGCVAPNDSPKTLKGYYALLFPTRYEGEGHPGTVIDGYSAGLPVISAKWHSYSDFVDEGKTGVGYPQFDYNGLVETLRKVKENPSMLTDMKENCLEKAKEYSAETIGKQISLLLNL